MATSTSETWHTNNDPEQRAQSQATIKRIQAQKQMFRDATTFAADNAPQQQKDDIKAKREAAYKTIHDRYEAQSVARARTKQQAVQRRQARSSSRPSGGSWSPQYTRWRMAQAAQRNGRGTYTPGTTGSIRNNQSMRFNKRQLI